MNDDFVLDILRRRLSEAQFSIENTKKYITQNKEELEALQHQINERVEEMFHLTAAIAKLESK